ncbi:MAG: HlyD family type I secretion periplasmic adaptor subunit [Pseudomonadota bacterium]
MNTVPPNKFGKPITIKPDAAQAAAMEKALQQAAGVQAGNAAEQDLQINRNEDWLQLQKNWATIQMQKLEARAEQYFMVDDELPLSRHVLLVTIFAFFCVMIIWALLSPLDEITKGEGRVIPSSEIQIIQNLEGGIVESFAVKEGDSVKAGQVVMRLRDVGAQADLGTNEAKYLGLLATITRLQAEAEGKAVVEFPESVMKGAPQAVTEELNAFRANQDKLRSQSMVYEQQLAQREQEVRELSRRASDLRGVINLSRQEKSMIEPLVARGSAPQIELIQLERGIQEKQTELNGVTTSMPRAQSAINEARARISEVQNTFRAQAQVELTTKQTENSAIKAGISALEDRKDRTEVTSPVNGTVKDFKVNTVGGVVRPGDPIVEIVPVDDQLLVEAKVRPADIAFIYPGQQAVVKITAYDFAVYGGLKGEVTEISADTIQNEKGEHFYRVKVRTFENTLKRKDEVLPIIPGMVAQVDVLTGKRTVMSYLMKPFVKTVDAAMTER